MKRISSFALAVILLSCGILFTTCSILRRTTETPTFVQVTAQGPFWANRWVNSGEREIELTVVFEKASGKIVYIDYTPSVNHISVESNATYFTRWTTADETRPATHLNYINAFIGMDAATVSRLQRPPAANASGGNPGIEGLVVDAVSGATETGRNFASSVVLAAQKFMTGEAVQSDWKP